MHQEDPGMEIAAKRAKFWGRARFKVSNSTIHILERWNISWSWNIYILERWNTHILEHIYLGARIFISWSWNIHILERRNTHILEHLYLGARIFMLWSWTIHILDLEHSHFTAGRLGGEHLQSWEYHLVLSSFKTPKSRRHILTVACFGKYCKVSVYSRWGRWCLGRTAKFWGRASWVQCRRPDLLTAIHMQNLDAGPVLVPCIEKANTWTRPYRAHLTNIPTFLFSSSKDPSESEFLNCQRYSCCGD